MLLGSRLGLAVYTLLPHRVGWALLSSRERALLCAGNQAHDGQRLGYRADPVSRQRHRAYVAAFLDRVQPARVLEVGPGSAAVTDVILEHPGVRAYVGVDINPSLVDRWRPCIDGRPQRVIIGTLAEAPCESVDAIILGSVVHHIPDRGALFREIALRLAPGGQVLCIDPAYYLLQMRKVWRKVRTPGHVARLIAEVRAGRYGTHAMCQVAEYRALARAAGLTITRVETWGQPRRVQAWRRVVPAGVWRWCAQEVVVEFAHIA